MTYEQQPTKQGSHRSRMRGREAEHMRHLCKNPAFNPTRSRLASSRGTASDDAVPVELNAPFRKPKVGLVFLPTHPRLRRLLSTVVAIAIALAVLALAQSAQARYDPIASGQTRFTFAKPFLSLLKSNDVTVKGTAGATYKAGTAGFPVSGGKLEPVAVVGSVEHEGALVFQANGHSLPLKGLVLKTTRRSSPLSAKFGGGQLKLASSSKLASTRSGFGVASKVSQIKLSAKAATRLDKKLGLKGVFTEGELLGSSTTDAQPETVSIKEGGRAELTLAPEFAAKLSALFVAVNPIFPAEHLGTPFTLRVTDGQIAPDASSGTLETAGALELIQQDGGQAFFRELAPELGLALTRSEYQFIASPTSPGPVDTGPLLGLGGGTVTSEPKARAISLTGAPLPLSAGTAQSLNETFAKPQGKSNVFQSGETLGTLSFSVAAE
jgi:hypothetical protein